MFRDSFEFSAPHSRKYHKRYNYITTSYIQELEYRIFSPRPNVDAKMARQATPAIPRMRGGSRWNNVTDKVRRGGTKREGETRMMAGKEGRRRREEERWGGREGKGGNGGSGSRTRVRGRARKCV